MYGEECVCVGRGIVKTSSTINQHSPGGVAARVKKTGISLPIKKRVTSLKNTTPAKVCMCV